MKNPTKAKKISAKSHFGLAQSDATPLFLLWAAFGFMSIWARFVFEVSVWIKVAAWAVVSRSEVDARTKRTLVNVSTGSIVMVLSK